MDIAIEPAEKYSTEELARKMLAHISGVDPEKIVFYRTENGKPQSNLPLYFNCSHSGEYVVCAVSEKDVGVDLERIRPVNPRLERTLTEAERRWLANLPSQKRDEGFLRLWTLKESWIKCRGGRLMEYRTVNFALRGEIRTIHKGAGFRNSAPSGENSIRFRSAISYPPCQLTETGGNSFSKLCTNACSLRFRKSLL